MQDTDYEAAWQEGEGDAPLTQAVDKAKADARQAVQDAYAQAHKELDEKPADEADDKKGEQA